MFSQVPVLVSSTQHSIRPIANFVPNIWGDQFLNYEPQNLEKQLAVENDLGILKEEVRKMLVESADDSFHQMQFIDDIQRLGVAYHFEREVEEALAYIYAAYQNGQFDNVIDINQVSLCFRLLRQQGIYISSDVFNKFKDKKGMFNESMTTDVEGLLSLYEAAYLGVRGEGVLEEALLFCTTHLEAFLKHESSDISNMVVKSLNRPLRKSMVRVNATHFISIYKERPSYSETLLRLAMLDFNHLQSMHKNELSDIRKWWRDMEFGKKFPFARDRMVECFFLITSIGFEPELCLTRRILTKLLYLVTIMDDIYDSYGTFEELSLFTPTLKGWSHESTDDLPDYMKIFHHVFLDCFEEIEEFMIKQRTLYRMSYAKEAVDRVVQSYFDEAKWYNNKYIPKVVEYLSVSMVSIGIALISTICFVGMPVDIVTEEDFQWLLNQPDILKATEVIGRLMDDIVSTKREKQTGQVTTAIECYTKQNGTSEEEAIQFFCNKVSEAWKDINKEFLKPTTVKRSLLSRFLHIAQNLDELYKEEDSYSLIGKSIKDGISALFINPLSL